MNNRLYLAAAGSGKTNFIVDEALANHDRRILILTFTNANEQEIVDLFIAKNKCVPKNVTVQSWFSFLLQHGVKPFQAYLYDDHVEGLLLVSTKSGVRFTNSKGIPVPWKESEVDKHFFSPSRKIYSDKISKFVIRVNDLSGGKVVQRIANLFEDIYVDEVQDLAGYDLKIIKELMVSPANFCMVGDPRQVTYNTHFPDVYKKYMNGKIKDFVENECKKIPIIIDSSSLKTSHRNRTDVCKLSSQLYPFLDCPDSDNNTVSEHDGMFFIDSKNLDAYLEKYKPMQLRLKINSRHIHPDYPVFNFGDSKGKSFNRTIIFPTSDMKLWLKNHSTSLAPLTRAQLYVALTRTRQSLAIYLDGESIDDYPFLDLWDAET